MFNLWENVLVSRALLLTKFFKVSKRRRLYFMPKKPQQLSCETVLVLLIHGKSKWRQNTFKRLEKGILQKILENFLIAGYLVFLLVRPFPAAGCITTAFLLSLSGGVENESTLDDCRAQSMGPWSLTQNGIGNSCSKTLLQSQSN